MITHRSRSILGDVPPDWDVVPLRRVVTRSTSGDWGSERGDTLVPVLRSTNFTMDRRLDFSDVALRAFSADDAAAFDIRRGDILLERSGGGPRQPVGRVILVEADLPRFGFSNFLQLLRVDDEAMNRDYAAWCLYQLHSSGVVERFQHQTTQMRNLDFRDYVRILIPNPGRQEQAKIAERISAVDATIQRLRSEIACAGRLRTALLQSLFTEGVPGRHTEYRSVTILRCVFKIPASWRFDRLGRFLSQVDRSLSRPVRRFVVEFGERWPPSAR